MVPLRSDVACREQCPGADLSFNGELVLLGIGQHIFVIEGWRCPNWQVVRPVDGSIRGGQRHWKALALDVAGAAIDKRCHELRRHWTAIENAKGSIANFVEVGGTFKRAVELSPADADTGFARTTG